MVADPPEKYRWIFIDFHIDLRSFLCIGFAIQILVFTIILCLTIPFVLMAIFSYLWLISGVLFAQAYNEGVERNAA